MDLHVGGVGLTPKKLSFETYAQWAEAIAPGLESALAGKREVPDQKPFSESWLCYALFYYKRMLSLEDVIESADAIVHGIPNPDEVAWAFLRLRIRGWLVVEGDRYGLTSEGRQAIETIVSQGNLERLNDWISSHPPSGPVTSMEVFLEPGSSRPRRD